MRCLLIVGGDRQSWRVQIPGGQRVAAVSGPGLCRSSSPMSGITHVASPRPQTRTAPATRPWEYFRSLLEAVLIRGAVRYYGDRDAQAPGRPGG